MTHLLVPLLAASLAAPAPRPPPPNGQQLLTAGAVSMAASVPLVAIGTALAMRGFSSEESASNTDGLTLMAIGVVALLAGIPMLAVGLHRRHVHRNWQRSPRVVLTPFQLRF